MICPRCLICNNFEREMKPVLMNVFGVFTADGVHKCDWCHFDIDMSKEEAHWEAIIRLIKQGKTFEEAKAFIKEEMYL